MQEKTETEILSENLVRAFVQFKRLRLEECSHDGVCLHHGMKHSEIMLLMVLADAGSHSKPGVSVSELSRLLRVKPPSITPILTGLEKKKMVERTIDPEDRRIVRVRMLADGRAFIREIWHRTIDRTEGLVRHLGAEKSRQLTDLVNETFTYIIEQNRHTSQP